MKKIIIIVLLSVLSMGVKCTAMTTDGKRCSKKIIIAKDFKTLLLYNVVEEMNMPITTRTTDCLYDSIFGGGSIVMMYLQKRFKISDSIKKYAEDVVVDTSVLGKLARNDSVKVSSLDIYNWTVFFGYTGDITRTFKIVGDNFVLIIGKPVYSFDGFIFGTEIIVYIIIFFAILVYSIMPKKKKIS